MILLFTDYGPGGIYVGQVKVALQRHAPGVPVVDLMHDAPAFSVQAGAHLLAALAASLPRGSVTLAVVDPGVGGPRDAVAVAADGRWYVGPDNGLLSVVAARAAKSEIFAIGWQPAKLSASFHGRDLFAPVAGMLAGGRRKSAKLRKKAQLAVAFGAEDLPEVIYVDHYGNLVSGLRAGAVSRARTFAVNGQRVFYARVFSQVSAGAAFWYENSLGLVEIAVNAGSAREKLGLTLGGRLG